MEVRFLLEYSQTYLVTTLLSNNLYRYIVAVSFIGGGNRRIRGKPPTYRKSQTNFVTQSCIEYTSQWAGFKLTTLVVIGTDCIGSYKSKYYTVTMVPPGSIKE